MANVTTELKVVVRSVGKGEIDKLSKALNDLGSKAAKPVNQTLKNSVADLKKLSSQSTTTRNNVRGFSAAFKELANNLEVGSKEFKEATAEAAKLDKQLASLEKRKPSRGQQLRRGAQTAGAIAAGGVFGGPEGALGAGIGGVFGGPAGAAVGAAIGAQVGQLRQALSATAEYAANIGKLRIALKGVTTSQEEYSQSLEFIQQTTKDFAIPQEVVTRQFTKLQASVQGAGGNIEDTKTAFNGIVAAVRATGGSLGDVDAALTATAQVFSKGKVSAEELRQQIGERLPGAFTLFAESMGLTPQELDKALEDGKVSLQDFQGFAKAIFEKYGETAQIIANSPKAAGDRLAVALERLNESVGRLLEPIGAAFQEVFTAIVDRITEAADALDRFLGVTDDSRIKLLQGQIQESNQALIDINREIRNAQQGGDVADPFGSGAAFGGGLASLEQERDQIVRQRTLIENELNALQKMLKLRGEIEQSRPSKTGLPGIVPDADDGGKPKPDKMKRTSQDLLDLAVKRNEALVTGNKIRVAELDFAIRIQQITEEFNAGEIDFNTAKKLELDAQNKLITAGLKLRAQEKKALANLRKAQEENNKELTVTEKLFESIKDTVAKGLTNAIEGLIDGTKSLGESLSGVLRQMASLFLQAGIGSFRGADGTGGSGLLGLFANGGVIAKNKIVPYASGGIVDKPTLFPMANGAGLMGEAGPEGILPLRRNSSGRLGVEASGSGTNIVVNVDASGTQVQGDNSRGRQLGDAISAAVKAELVNQRRPGGLLAS